VVRATPAKVVNRILAKAILTSAILVVKDPVKEIQVTRTREIRVRRGPAKISPVKGVSSAPVKTSPTANDYCWRVRPEGRTLPCAMNNGECRRHLEI